MTDVLYILGSGSQWNDNELRYSLRSVEQFLPHGVVHIAGEYPTFVRHVHHIPVADLGASKQTNGIEKIRAAVATLFRPFWLMNDDFFLLRPLDDTRPVCRGTVFDYLANVKRSSVFTQSLQRTSRVLRAHGIRGAINYAAHTPARMEPGKVQQVLDLFDAAGVSEYSFRTAYYNLFPEESRQQSDVKIQKTWRLPDPSWECFSTDDVVIRDPRCQAFLEFFYPVPSRYESTSYSR